VQHECRLRGGLPLHPGDVWVIISTGEGKTKQGWLVCAGCGTREKHPTRESDCWLACWCEDPDRCLACSFCKKCWEEFD